MTLSQITKIRGPGIHTTSNIVSHNINSSGIITATAFSGPFTGIGNSSVQAGIITATKIDLNGDIDVDGHTNLDNVSIAGVSTFTGDATFSGNVSIGGTLTYEDVTNIDSVGLVTARDGVFIPDNKELKIGNTAGTPDLKIYHSSSDNNSYIKESGTGSLFVNASRFEVSNAAGTEALINAIQDTGVSLYDGTNTVRLATTTTGATLDHTLTIGGAAGSPGRINFIEGGAVSEIRVTRNSDANSDLQFKTERGDGTQVRAKINYSGDFVVPGNKVGIGTDAPTELIDVLSTSNSPTIQVRTTGAGAWFEADSASSGYSGLKLSSGGTQRWLVGSYATNNFTIKDGGTGGDERFTIVDGTGKIGINSTSPNRQLSIVSNGGQLDLHDTDGTTVGYYTNAGVGQIFCRGNSGSTAGSFEVWTHPAGGSITKRLQINSNGHLTIGTASAAGGRLYFESTSGAAQYIASGGTNNQDLLIASSAGTKLQIGADSHILPGAADSQDLGSTSKEFRNLYLGNSGKAFFGSAQELSLYHDGNNSYLKGDANAGLVSVQGQGNVELFAYDKVLIRVNAGESAIICNNNNSVDLYYDASVYTTPKLKTSKVGVIVNGEVAATQDYPTIKPTLDLNFAATKTLDPRIEYYRYGPASYIDANGKVVLVGEDVPRFDHDPDTGECKGLLIEGERTNLFPNGVRPGDKFNHSKTGTFTENTTETTAPDGSYTATKWTFTDGDPYLYHNQTLLANVTYTMSMWVKAGTNMAGDWVQFRIGGGPYSIQTNCIIPTDGTWRRISYTRTIGGSNESSANIGFEPQTSPSGNPASGDVIYIWGAQLESGTTASSFIPTYGYTQTRGADKVQITGKEFTDFYNQAEGTIFLSASYETDARAVANVTIDDTSNYAEYTEVGYRAGGASSQQLSSYIRKTSGGDQYYKNWSNAITQGTEFKIALAYKDDNYASHSSTSGTPGLPDTANIHTDNSGTTSRLYDRLKFSEVHTVGHGGVGHYRRFMYYSKRLTNNQLFTLTL